MVKKYCVAKNAAITVGGVVLGEGEEIPAGKLSDESFKILAKAKKIVPADNNAGAAGNDGKAEPQANKDGK